MTHIDILDFWFKEISPEQWFQKSDEFDHTIQKRFGEVHHQASQGELYPWRENIYGRLAEIIVLDQFSRNIYRDDPRAFACDQMSLVLAQEAVAQKLDQELKPQEKSFLYMPYMHSESKLIHEQAVRLYSAKGLEYNLDFEIKHKKIIDRFGRYPHRNEILGRTSTPEEIEFLKEEGSSF
ncbi:MAG: hypothetical protein CME62_17750 [Halobacteriovoraceae bacterium]|nr:hypothetical protein [Halobacteriovoraceae bacterium]|tara:strand:- start:1619 stop:2158 length:540 start_codon:yes stop_codon:yes gene_type:complete